VTVLHPGVRQRLRIRVLDDSDRRALQALLDEDPIVNAVVSARIHAVGSLRVHRLGGTVIGVRDGDRLVGACFSGGNLLPIGGDAQTWAALARFVTERPRVCTSVVGRAEAVAVMWPVLSAHWGPARSVRAAQPLLFTEGVTQAAIDGAVRPATMAELERYIPAAAAMFAEELGISPHIAPGTEPFRARITELVRSGRAFVRYDHRGQVVFKAEIGAVSERTAQVQGVWVRPDLRQRGIGTAAMAAVLKHAAALAPSVSLYVNDYNVAGRRLYDRLGMRQLATLSTVLL
jgi:predicted GNAT family acetyltransferase